MALNNPYETLVKISEQINSLNDTNILIDHIMDLALETLGAERGFILLKSSNKKVDFDVVVSRNISEEKVTKYRQLSSSVVNQVLEQGKGVEEGAAEHPQSLGIEIELPDEIGRNDGIGHPIKHGETE